jgi:hypothetical protein
MGKREDRTYRKRNLPVGAQRILAKYDEMEILGSTVFSVYQNK